MDMKTQRLLREAAKTIEDLAKAHHCTVKPSKLHRPVEQGIQDCKSSSCQKGVELSEKIRVFLREN